MLRWFKIAKRTGNAVLSGKDLGSKPKVKVFVTRNEDLRKLPKPKFNRKMIFDVSQPLLPGNT